jgi:putative alpha-1,2-mannosidase
MVQSSSLGNFPIFPQVGCPGDNYQNCHFSKFERKTKRIHGTAVARPGYFAVTLNTSIKAEMTVTNHTALYRFSFPNDTTKASVNSTPLVYSPLILVELNDLQFSIIDGRVQVNNSTGRITGNGTFSPSFGAGQYSLNFCADFYGKIRTTGIFTDLMTTQNSSNIQTHGNFTPAPAGGFVQFEAPENNQILTRVGLSFISVKQACRNAEQEIPDFDFDGTRSAAEAAWRKKLSVMTVDSTGVSDELQTVFWSGTYRSMISPQDYTGENPLWRSNEPYYDSYYCIWDSFRSIHPLLTILDPHSQTLMVRSLIDIYRHEGNTPCNKRVQILTDLKESYQTVE